MSFAHQNFFVGWFLRNDSSMDIVTIETVFSAIFMRMNAFVHGLAPLFASLHADDISCHCSPIHIRFAHADVCLLNCVDRVWNEMEREKQIPRKGCEGKCDRVMRLCRMSRCECSKNDEHISIDPCHSWFNKEAIDVSIGNVIVIVTYRGVCE